MSLTASVWFLDTRINFLITCTCYIISIQNYYKYFISYVVSISFNFVFIQVKYMTKKWNSQSQCDTIYTMNRNHKIIWVTWIGITIHIGVCGFMFTQFFHILWNSKKKPVNLVIKEVLFPKVFRNNTCMLNFFAH